MTSICEQIQIAYTLERGTGTIPHTFDALVEKFHELLNSVSSSEQPLYVFVDSLDQLNDSNGARSQPWKWLPKEITTPYTHVIISTLPDERYGILQAIEHVIPPHRLVQVKSLDPDQAVPILQEWLAYSGRALADEQLEVVVDSIKRAGNATMLHLRLLFDRVVTWRSYDNHHTSNPLPSTVQDLIRLVYRDLEHLHGESLISAVMGLICVSRSGLSNENILDLISGDDDVLGFHGQPNAVLRFHDPPVRRLPPLVFTRLKAQLKDYVVERDANGTSVLSLYHRQFWEVAEELYVSNKDKRRSLSAKLAVYFSGALAAQFPERNIASHPLRFKQETDDASASHVGLPNRQKLHELPHAQRGCGQHTELAESLCDSVYLEAVFDSGRLFAADLLREYQNAVSNANSSPTLKSHLIQFFRFVSKWFHVLCMEPSLIVGLANNWASTSVVAQEAKRLVESGIEKRKFLKWTNAPKSADPCVQTVLSQMKLNGCAFAMSGSVYAVCGGGLCRVIDVFSASEVARFQDHQGLVVALCFSPDGKQVLSVGRDNSIFTWSSTNADLTHRLTSPASYAVTCAWNPVSSDMIVTAHANGAVYVWQLSTHTCVRVLQAHTGPVSSVAFSPDGNYLVSASWDKTSVMWNMTTFNVLHRWQCAGAVNGIAWSGDGSKIAIATSAVKCEVWTVNGNCGSRPELLHSLAGHKSEVWGCAFSPDSSELVTVGADRRGVVYNVVSGMKVGSIPQHPEWVMGCHWIDDKILTVADKTSRLFDRSLLSGELPEINQFLGLKFSSDGAKLFTISKTLKTQVLNPVSLVVEREMRAEGSSQDCGTADLRGDNSAWAFTAYSNQYSIVHDGIRTETHSIGIETANVVGRWNPSGNGELMVTGHGDQTTCLLTDPDSAEITMQFDNHGWAYGLDWSVDGKWAATAATRATEVWDVANRNPNPIFSFHPGKDVAINNKRTHLAILKLQGDGYEVEIIGAMIVEIESGVEVGIEDKVVVGSRRQMLSWTADDKYVLITSDSTTEFGCVMVSVFEAQTGKCVTRFCSPEQSNLGRVAVCSKNAPMPLLACGDDSGAIYVHELA
eukprot:c13019_g4_i1.p1 GENE.c13019_g4_i1~~c13019_g4_i1.p1  ORF type:complete len:1137 (+),score=258.97 c13019_g4_i1:178-3411(+)